MRLTKLELQGFKSFADNTQMQFDAGVTAIVGPNGCGKSNVSDAVRWVLGEQRARLLRGAKMEEVIFQGSSARRAVNVAEVSLHFSNEDGTLPVAFQEVVITRRLSRSGESDYFLNRAPCRLRDISDLLRGTGLGADTGVVIESKMIDALLSDRPDDRRELFEEAAGVGLYRDRRRTAERRLDETTVDLQRLDDLINEVQSQVRSLARQRRRAEKHSELNARRFTVELALAKREMEAWHDELGRLTERVRALREGAPEADGAVGAAEQARDTAHGNRAAAEAQRTELLRLVSSQREQALQIRSEMKVAEERQRNSSARRQRAETEATEGVAHGTRLTSDIQLAVDDRARQDEVLAAARGSFTERQQREDESRQMVARSRAMVDDVERAHRELQDRSRRVDIERERTRQESDELVQRLEQLAEERAQLADALSAVAREIEDASVVMDDARRRVAEAVSSLESARATDREARERESAARAELFRADETHTSIQGRVNALDSLERERVGLAPAAARLLRERDRFGEGAVLGPLSDFINADEPSALLVERFLGATVHAVVVRDMSIAADVRAWHATANPGPLLLLPLDAIPDALVADERPDALSHRVDSSGPVRAWVRGLLGHASPVDDGAAFIDMRGAVWLPGLIGGAGPLRRRAELFALRAELTATEKARASAIEVADAARAAAQESERAAVAASAGLETAQVEARRATEHHGELERRRQRVEKEVGDADALSIRLTQRRDQLTDQAARLDDEALAGSRTVLESAESGTRARDALAVSERTYEDAARGPHGRAGRSRAVPGASPGGARPRASPHGRTALGVDASRSAPRRVVRPGARRLAARRADGGVAAGPRDARRHARRRRAAPRPRRGRRAGRRRGAHVVRARARRRATARAERITTSCTRPSCGTRSSAAAARRSASGSRPSGGVRSTTC